MTKSVLLILTLLAGTAHAQQASDISEIVVTATPRRQLPKQLEPMVNTPQQVVAVTAGLLGEFQVGDVQRALEMSSLVANHGNDAAPGNDVEIHGFTTQYDMYMDGLPEYGKFYRDTAYYDDIEIVSGPSSVLFGRGSTGGAINFDTKKPIAGDHYRFETSFGTDDRQRITGDFNQDFGDGWEARMVMVGDHHGVAERNDVEYKRLGVFPEVSYHGDNFRVLASWLHQNDFDRPDYGVPFYYTNQGGFVALNGPRAANYGFSNDYDRTNVNIVTVTTETDLSDDVMLRAQFRWANYLRAFRVTTPLLANDPVFNDALQVSRKIQDGYSRDDFLDLPIDIVADFETFGIEHKLIGGIEFQRIGSSPNSFAWSGVPTVSFYNPDPSVPISGTRTLQTAASGRIYSQGVYVSDTITLPEDLQLLLSARGDRFDATWTVGNTRYRHIDLQPSIRVALVYPFLIDDRAASVYAAYGTSFDPQGEGLSLSSKAANLDPEETENYEIGAKWQIGPKLLASASLFHTEKTNLRETDPNDPNKAILVGDGLARGLDLQLSRRLFDRWDMTIGYTYLLTEITASPNKDLGNPFRNAPRHRVSAFLTYETPEYELGGGIQYSSMRYASSLPDATTGQRFSAPDFVTLSLMAGYTINEHMKVQFNIDNITDAYYISGVDDTRATPGAGRTFVFSARWKY